MAYVDGHYSCAESGNGVTVLVAGKPSCLQCSNDRVTADIILAEYEATFEHCEGLNEEHPAADKIAMLKGPFAFIIFDVSGGETAARVIAARDPKGQEPFFWGTTLLGERLLLGSDRTLIETECADADAFPPGTLFVSGQGTVQGTIISLRYMDLPDISSTTPPASSAPSGMTGSLCRPASCQDFSSPLRVAADQ
eukprot:jgi/Astpho2/6700/Aster-05052